MTDNIDVKITTDSSDAARGAQQASNEIKRVGESAHDAGEHFEKLAELLIEAFAVEKIVEFVSKMAEMAEQSERMAQVIGTSAEEVQALSRGFELLGGSGDTLSRALIHLSQQVGEALSDPAGKSAQAFRNFGVSQQYLKDNTNDIISIFYKMADGFAVAEDGTNKMANGAQLVGQRVLQNFLPSLNKGSDGVKELGEEAKKTGAVLSEETTQKFADLREEMTKMELTATGAGYELANALYPAILGITEGLTEFFAVVQEFTKYIDENWDAAIQHFVDAIPDEPEWMKSMIQWLREMRGEAEKTNAEFAGLSVNGAAVGEGISVSPSGVKASNDTGTEAGFGHHKEKHAKHALPPLASPKQEKDKGDPDKAEQDLNDRIEKNFYESQLLKLNAQKHFADESFAVARQHIEAQVQLEKLGTQDAIAQLHLLEDARFEAGKTALEEQLQLGGITVQQQQRINDQLRLLALQHQAQIQKIDDDGAIAQKKKSDEVFNSISQGFQQMTAGILQGTQTWQQSLQKLFSNLVVMAFEAMEKILFKWIAKEIAQTSATETGNVIRVASDTSAALTSSAVGAASAKTSIAQDAASAAAAVYDSVAKIPYVGWLLAPPAAAVAFGAVLGYDALVPSFDVGSYDVPANMPANIHKGEMIIPKPFADSLRENGGLGGSGVTIQVNAIDQRTGAKFLMDNAAHIAKAISQQSRNANSNLSYSG